MNHERFDLLPGALEMMVLKTLLAGTQHGYAIARSIQGRSANALSIEEGTLYPALHRMETRGWIRARWGLSDAKRKAKFYELTRTGERELEQRLAAWERFTGAVAQVMGASDGTRGRLAADPAC